ncbi:MAG TPA: plasma-membrane proton-efflux P-type ATPase [Solirubrobacter sp.]|nr:plasma-membrane proton-efflux P-type ATPase [Solirubrobacter sp.]
MPAPPPSGPRRLVQDQRTADDLQADERRGPDSGLTTQEAAVRLQRYGPNALPEKRRNVAWELLSHFWQPIPWMIELALVLTAVTARWTDFGVILALLLLNGLVGFWEEHQAANAIDALRQRLATQARALRDGAWRTLPTEQLVPGDLITLQRGDVVPADGALAEGMAEVDESALTGESLPVDKRGDAGLFSGTVISRGAPRMRVLATGPSTELGRTAALAAAKPPASHFQEAIFAIGRYLIALALVLVAVIVVVSLLRGTGLTETLEFALVVTIASIPVALPAVLSVTMAVGARHLATREAVVSHLPAVEEMSGVDVLCSDKTGTITRNQLTLVGVTAIGQGIDRDAVLRAAALTAEPGGSDPIDAAILAARGGAPAAADVLDFEPFDADRKRAEARVRDADGSEHRVAKGAVQAIVELAGEPTDVARRVAAVTAELATKGHRALAVARTDADGAWRVIGVLAIQDPPREDSRETLARARELGVEVKMVTGDRVEIARQIGAEVGIGSQMLEADALASLADDALGTIVEAADGFAQVVPEDKYRIVRALQARGHIVAMTGDGVNDAPALRRADAGIAVSGATDAARAAADIVLLAPGLSVIVEAIHGAREVFRRMTNYAIYRITETIRVVLFVTLSIVALGFFPVTPTQIVLLAILNDAAILTIAYDRVQPSPRPERWDLREVLTMAAVLGLVGVVESFTLVALAVGPLGLSHAETQTLMYLKLSIAGHLTMFVARTRGRLWSRPHPAPVLLTAVIATQVVATVIAAAGVLMTPLRWQLIPLAWGYALVWMLLLDQLKLFAYRTLVR